MPYTPPVGIADLTIGSVLGYTPPIGIVNLDIGHLETEDRLINIVGTTASPTGVIVAKAAKIISIAGTTAAPTGNISAEYDPNLISAVNLLGQEIWQEGLAIPLGERQNLRSAIPLNPSATIIWQYASPLNTNPVIAWKSTDSVGCNHRMIWYEAESIPQGIAEIWQYFDRRDSLANDHWQNATGLRAGERLDWRGLPTVPVTHNERWQDGFPLSLLHRDAAREGTRLIAVEIEVWQRAGYPSNAYNPRKHEPRPYIPFWDTWLRINCPLPGTTLRIGRTPCIIVAEHEVRVRRTYMSTNSASLVRLPDLIPLPVTAMSIETDFDSWCWGLSATLAGPDAWPLVQPNPLACEVMATINGQSWKFLLDVPSTNRSFNSDRVTLKGRSRSAWLHDPYTLSSDRSESNAREMVQLAEAALDSTGWTIDWQLDNWLVPAGRYNSWNTPIGVLIRLVNTTDDGLYTDPELQVITAQKRWPVASWLLDGETMDLLIPESAVISLTQSPVYSQPLNGVYVSGTSHGALALVKIAGTDGALQPADPLVNELLCDEAGVAARARGMNLLSDSGAGWAMDAEVLFTPEVGLVKPGMIVSIAGIKGISRSCRITAQRSGNALSVRQSIGLERREIA